MRSRTDLPTVGGKGHGALAADVFPDAYHQSLFPPVAEPAFENPDELERTWGVRWGASSEVGRLRAVLMRRPGAELERIRADAWDPTLNALVDPDEGWYWASTEPPDLARVREQYEGLLAVLEDKGVEIHFAEALPPRFSKAMYTRDPLVTVPGGAIIGRLAPRMRRGEEQRCPARSPPRHADTSHDHRNRAARGRILCEADARGCGVRDVDPLQ